MTTDYSPRPSRTRTGTAAPEPLPNTRALADELVCHFLESMVSRRAAPDDETDVTAVTRACLGVAVTLLDGGEITAPENIRPLKFAATRWARHGVPIEMINHAVHESFQVGLELIAASEAGTDADKLTVARSLAAEVLDIITSTMSLDYIKELQTVIAEHRRPPPALTAALLGGHDTATITRESGVEVAPSYALLAVRLPQHDDERAAPNTRINARRTLRRVQLAIAAQCPPGTLSLLDVHGGIVLIPSFAEAGLDALLPRLSAAAETPLIATCAEATPPDIPHTVDHLRELLNLARQLRYPPGLYRFADLAVEYQLTRPSPARAQLGSLLDPLDPHPMLMETLRIHLGNKLNRRRSARQLNVHMNTVDYRLRKITELTGFDLSIPEGVWRAQSALVVRSADTEPV
ncbi:PucR family transcriptional regulator [Nocardia sp. NPDC059177]|uniref:PucR family transcriptional regulator n=1 Tax=Nocardia sp. NPDC059177 TaxID=3346759 RepID=UPI0036CF2354